MRIPYTQLSPATLRAAVLEIVTRDGTDHSPVDQRVNDVVEQLELGHVELHFNQQTASCSLVTVANSARPD